MSSRDDLGSLEPNFEDLEDLDRYEPLDDLEPATVRSRRSPVLSILGVLLVIAAAAAGVWYFLDLGGDDTGIPLVTADPEPVKVRPEKPGGLEVPHQEISVLNQPTPEPTEAGSRPEVLLPPPEAPLPVPPTPPAPAEAPRATVPAVPTIPVEEAAPVPSRQPAQVTEAVIPPVPPLPPGVAPTEPGDASSGQAATAEPGGRLVPPPLPPAPPVPPVPKVAAAPAAPPPPPVAETLPKPAPEVERPPPLPPPAAAPAVPPPPAAMPEARVETPPAASVVSRFRANVVSAKREADANQKVAQMRKAYADLFGPLPLRVQRVDLGAKGTWYRVQAGAFEEVGQAKALCQELMRRGEKGCWVAGK